MTELYTPKEAAALLKVSTSTLRYWRTIGRGPAVVRLESGTFRYRQDDLMAYIDARHISYPCGKTEEQRVNL
jgi:DNA-binding transcriptional MerR regulator